MWGWPWAKPGKMGEGLAIRDSDDSICNFHFGIEMGILMTDGQHSNQTKLVLKRV